MGRVFRVCFATGLAIGGVGFVISPVPEPAPDGQARLIRLAGVDTADSPLGDGTALMVGGTTNPLPTQAYLDAFNTLYLQPRGFTGTPQAVFTPESAYPFSGVKSLPYPTSVAQGTEILDSTILSQAASGHVDVTNPVVIVGWSQSSNIASLVMSQLEDQGVPSDDVHFLLVGDPNNPAGGMFTRLDGLAPTGVSVAGFGGSFGQPATPDDLYPADIYTNEYDSVGDVPRYPIDVLSDLNNVLGVIQHMLYPALTPEQIASAVQLPTTAGDTLTSYYMIPAEVLPLLFPLQLVPFIGQPLYDLLEPDTAILVNLGYGNIEHGWDPGPANVLAPFALFPTDLNWGDVVTALSTGLQKGITDAVAQLHSPDNYNPSAVLDNPLLNQIADVFRILGFTDASDFSQLLNLPTLLEFSHATLSNMGFPASDVSLFSSSPAEIVNDLSGTAAADYALLLPIVDFTNALLTTIPGYDLSVVGHQLEAGNLLGALTDPLIADEDIIGTDLTVLALPIITASGGTLLNLSELFDLVGLAS